MRLLDLFCGRFGWSRAFAARGWECVGVDLVEPPEIPQGCIFVQKNILEMDDFREFDAPVDCPECGGTGNFYGNDEDGAFLRCDDCDMGKVMRHFGPFDFICASSPCEQFSVHGMKHFHPNPPYPELGLKLFNHTREICEASGVPYVMENVRPAQQFVGRAVHHCGPFYLWGNGVPLLMAQGVTKGIDVGSSKLVKGMTTEEKREYRRQFPWNQAWSSSKQRKHDTAKAATIPPELSKAVCDYAERILTTETDTRGHGTLTGISTQDEM